MDVEVRVTLTVGKLVVTEATVGMPVVPASVPDASLEGLVRVAALKAMSAVRLADPAPLRALFAKLDPPKAETK